MKSKKCSSNKKLNAKRPSKGQLKSMIKTIEKEIK